MSGVWGPVLDARWEDGANTDNSALCLTLGYCVIRDYTRSGSLGNHNFPAAMERICMKPLIAAIDMIDDIEVFGRVRSVQGLLIEIVGPVRELRVGGRVQIETVNGEQLAAEIIGFRDGRALCLPFGQLSGVRLGCKAVFQRHDGAAFPSQGWLGRVINADGEPIDGK